MTINKINRNAFSVLVLIFPKIRLVTSNIFIIASYKYPMCCIKILHNLQSQSSLFLIFILLLKAVSVIFRSSGNESQVFFPIHLTVSLP